MTETVTHRLDIEREREFISDRIVQLINRLQYYKSPNVFLLFVLSSVQHPLHCQNWGLLVSFSICVKNSELSFVSGLHSV